MKKYNPYMDSMIANYRDLAKKSGLRTDHLSNEELFNIIEYWSGMPTGEETEQAVLDHLRENPPKTS